MKELEGCGPGPYGIPAARIILPGILLRACAGVLGLSILLSPSARAAECGPLFVIERSVNANVVVYEAVRDAEGRFDPVHPIRAFWLLKARDGRRDALSFLERTLLYGVEASPAADKGTFRFVVRGLRQLRLTLGLHAGCARAFAKIDGREAILSRVFVVGRGTLIPKIDSIELDGADLETGEALREDIAVRGNVPSHASTR